MLEFFNSISHVVDSNSNVFVGCGSSMSDQHSELFLDCL